VVLIALAVPMPKLTAGMNVGRGEPKPPTPSRGIQPTYKVEAGLDGEIFPVFANYASLQKPRERKLGTVAVTVTNSTDSPLRNRLTVQVPGWSDQEIQMVEMAAGEVRTFQFAPTFLPRLYANHEIAAATALVQANDLGGRVVFQTTVPLRLRAAQDMYWGPGFRFAQFIASWVTPHDPLVQQLLSRAKEFAPHRRLPGYEPWKSVTQQERSTYAQAKAIYRALQRKGISYVKSSHTFGSHAEVSERVRLPHESLRHVSANCIDGAVMYASLFENLGMEPVVVLVPGHAYVGVRLTPGSKRYVYIETSVTGRTTFEKATRMAARGIARYKPSEITRIEISRARQAGIYPMPTGGKGKRRASPVRRSEQAEARGE
jgi:hypothetical protein